MTAAASQPLFVFFIHFIPNPGRFQKDFKQIIHHSEDHILLYFLLQLYSLLLHGSEGLDCFAHGVVHCVNS